MMLLVELYSCNSEKYCSVSKGCTD